MYIECVILPHIKHRYGLLRTFLLQRGGYLLLGIGIILLGLSFYLYEQQPSPPTAHVSESKSVQVAKAPSSNKPSTAKVNSYTVPAAWPKYISIPSIGVNNTMVIGLGLLKSGAIATPDNIYETGWYKGSSLPGKPGAMFIFGHVSSWTADGVFYNLKRLMSGDTIMITKGDNTILHYVVVSSKIYPHNAVNMSQVLAPIDPKVPGLNLMTCTGRVIPGTSEFNERLVVFTKQVSA